MINNMPKVTIGMPVYNGEKYLRQSLGALVSQSFIDFELIISDNASTDKSRDICMEYCEQDDRIKYFRHPTNIGPWPNFQYVLDKAQGDYFMWTAADDIRSSDFVELNYNFLSLNSEYVASTCPNIFEGDSLEDGNFTGFSLNENENYKRYVKFFDYCWHSHGAFYSLIRINELKECSLIQGRPEFVAIDWGVDLFLASRGKINCTVKGYTIFGINGDSQNPNNYKKIRTIDHNVGEITFTEVQCF